MDNRIEGIKSRRQCDGRACFDRRRLVRGVWRYRRCEGVLMRIQCGRLLAVVVRAFELEELLVLVWLCRVVLVRE